MRVDVETTTTVKVGFEDGEKCIYPTFFVQIQMRCGAQLISTRNKDIDLVIL